MTKPARFVLIGLWLLIMSACTWLVGEEAALPEDGQLLVYTTLQQDEIDLYLADLALAYPDIQVQAERMMPARLQAERRAPQADLLWGLDKVRE